MEGMVRTVAKAIKAKLIEQASSDGADIDCESIARAAIEAMREPTRDMSHFGHGHWTDGKGAISIWQVMIDAALKEQVSA